MSAGGGQPELPPEPPRPSPFGAFRLTGILAAGLLALVIGISTFSQVGGDGGGDGSVSNYAPSDRELADVLCRDVRSDLTRLPRRDDLASAAQKDQALRELARRFEGLGPDDLAAAVQRWSVAQARLARALGRGESAAAARASRAVRVARRKFAAAAQAYGSQDCMRLARRG